VPVNDAFLGFSVGPGHHRVRLDYRPAGWTFGLALFGLGVVVAMVWGFWEFRETRRAGSLPPQHLDRPPLEGADGGG